MIIRVKLRQCPREHRRGLPLLVTGWDWDRLGQQIALFSPTSHDAVVVLMHMDVRRLLASDAWHLVMVVEALGEVFCLTDVDGMIHSRPRFPGEDVVGRHGLEGCADGEDVVLIQAAGFSEPDARFRCHFSVLSLVDG